ncbi:MAG: class I SAM-dependent methyltransferase [Rhodospirillales bacterium]
MTNPFLKARATAESSTEDRQERNRQWWERLPMTYADWDAEDRLPKTPQDFLDIEKTLLSDSPFLGTKYDFSQVKGLRILEIGCGSGVLSCRLAREAAEVTAIDITETAVTLAKRNATGQNVTIDILNADAERMPFADNSFDYVFSWGVLHHSSNMDNALKEVSRVLTPGGHGLVMVYHRRSIAYYIHGLYWLLIKGKIFKGDTLHTVQRHYTDGYHHRYVRKSEMAEILSNAGLSPTKFTITQYRKKIIPGCPSRLDEKLKARFGMCLITEFKKSA